MPDWSHEIRHRLAALSLDPARENEIVEELSQHLDDRYEELRRLGVDEPSARLSALEELHEHDVLARELRTVERARSYLALGAPGRGRIFGALWQDMRYAMRTFRSQPAFAAVAVFTFAIGIGACTLIFSAVQGVIRRPLPYENPEQLVAFWGTAPEKGLPEVNMPTGMYNLFRDKTRALTSVAAYSGDGSTLTGIGDPERLEGATVTLDFFKVFRARMYLGRAFLPGEDVRNAPPTVVLSYALWQRKFAGDSALVGRAIAMDGQPTTVVGILPQTFEFPNRAEYWTPQPVLPEDFSNCWCFNLVGRARDGVNAKEVGREIASITDDFGMTRRDVFPDAKRGGSRFVAVPLTERIVGNLQTPLVVLLGAVGLVLLIGCANIANLVLVRATSRAREIALRCCLGAGPGRIAAQLLTESVLLSLIGAAAGLLLALWGVFLLRQLPLDQFPRMNEVRLDPVVLAFTAGVAILTGLVCGVAPALRVSRVDLQDAIKAGARGSSTAPHRRLSDGFVVTQFALSLVLLVAAGLLLRSYHRLSSLDLGYRPENVLVGRISLPYPRYDTSVVVRAFYDRLLDQVRSVPGVNDVGMANRVPLTRGNPQRNVIAEGREPRPGEPVLVANVRVVTPEYFRAIGTPLLEGRVFDKTDDTQSQRVAVVDEAFAKHFWPKENAIGKRVRYGGDTSSTRWMQVVGVVRNVKHNSLDEQTDLQIYEPFARVPTWGNYLAIRSTSAPEGLAQAIRKELGALDPALALYDVHTMQEAVRTSLSIRRLMNVLLGGFAVTALILAAIGIYGVISLSVNGRVREFGIRLALGAKPTDVSGMVLRHGMLLAAAGVGIGIAGALYLTRFLQRLLFGVGTFDWLTFGTVAVLLAGTALLASYLPARRATKADPLTALRSE